MAETYGYSEKVMELFRNPKNMGSIKDADGIGTVGNPQCGDVMKIYMKIGKNKQNQDVIKNIKVETFGCVAALTSSSILTEMAKGKTVGYALSITKDEVAKKLGGLPPIKYHCSVLAVDALRSAIEDYQKKAKNKRDDDIPLNRHQKEARPL